MSRRHDQRTQLMLLEDARRGLADVAAGRTVDADEAIRQLQLRRAEQRAGQPAAPVPPRPPAG
ncbi:hypothetical protein [Aquincola tertiaricarbonis]|uniref:hypothetical protein n=1 Tax=Aquincola tertiaricarbonis TaxID=391953 RepID=UPI000614C549|nr:hypothetical protein [Aquincola tertiaricarbonis]